MSDPVSREPRIMPQILPTKLQTKYIYNFVLKLGAGATENCIFEILGFKTLLELMMIG